MTLEVVILSRSLPFHSLGGMEIVTWDLSRELVRIGHSVKIITTSLPQKESEFEQDGVTVIALENTPSGRYSSAWWRESHRYFEENCMSTTLAVISVSAAGFSLLPLKSKLPNTPFIMQAHGTSWGEITSKLRSRSARSILSAIRNFIWLPKDLIAYRQFDIVVSVGERVNRDLAKLPTSLCLPKIKVRLINNGIDTGMFRQSPEERLRIRKRLGIGEHVPVLISASRLHEQKGVSHCLKAFSELKRTVPDAVYLIAGDGPNRAELESLSDDLGVNSSVHFIGSVSRPELANWLQSADAFLFLTNHVEGLPLNVLEALATGLPSVVSDHLMLFESNLLNYSHPLDYSKTSQLLHDIMQNRSIKREELLPLKFSLRHSANLYSELISSTKRYKESHAHS